MHGLVERLRLLKVWAGDPSITAITAQVHKAFEFAGRPRCEWPARATVGDCFRVRPRPNADLLLAVVEVLHPDPSYVHLWRQALRIVRGEAEAATFVTVADRLPDDLAQFVGRGGELAALRALLDRDVTAAVAVIDGMPGVGKTALAVHAGHRFLRDHRVDRVLFTDLRGVHPDPARPPADPAAVLDGFLRLLGVRGEQVPHHPDRDTALRRRARLYRRLLAGRTVLVVLDNAADAEQVRHLLPGTGIGSGGGRGPSLALVTSRRRLAGLPGARRLPLDAFSAGESLAVLRAAAGADRFDADPAAARAIADLLGHLPLALAATAHRIGTTRWPLADHLDRLTAPTGPHATGRPHDRRGRLRRALGLRLEERVRNAVDLSYRDLDPEGRRVLRALALHPGTDLETYAAAALADTDPRATRHHLHALVAANLLRDQGTCRYALHDLIRAHATDRAHDEDPPSHHRAALARLCDHYAHTSTVAADLLYPYEAAHRPRTAPARTPGPRLATGRQAEAWLDAELDNLLATATHAAHHGRPGHTLHQSATLQRHLRTRGRYTHATALHHLAVEAAHAVGDDEGRTAALVDLARVHHTLGRHEEAAGHLTRALDLARSAGDRAGEVAALVGLGHVHRARSDDGPAAGHLTRALRLARCTADRVGELEALVGLGHVHRARGRHQRATGCYQRALAIAGDTGHRPGQFEAYDGLGRCHRVTGRHAEALACHHAALVRATEWGQPADRARAHDGLARTHHALHHHARARHHWQAALHLLAACDADHTCDPQVTAASIRAGLADLDPVP